MALIRDYACPLEMCSAACTDGLGPNSGPIGVLVVLDTLCLSIGLEVSHLLLPRTNGGDQCRIKEQLTNVARIGRIVCNNNMYDILSLHDSIDLIFLHRNRIPEPQTVVLRSSKENHPWLPKHTCMSTCLCDSLSNIVSNMKKYGANVRTVYDNRP
jgi:hypothetical protein